MNAGGQMPIVAGCNASSWQEKQKPPPILRKLPEDKGRGKRDVPRRSVRPSAPGDPEMPLVRICRAG